MPDTSKVPLDLASEGWDGLLTGHSPPGSWGTPEARAANTAFYQMLQVQSPAVIAESYMLGSEYDPDEPVPLWPSLAGLAVSCPES
jgi:hypothetical protein